MNYLSQPTTYAPPAEDSNFNLLEKVALAQQQTYSAKHSEIQNVLNQFGAIKTLRPEDDAYIAAKLNGIITQINTTSGDLASASNSDKLMGQIKGASQDPFILNALEQTAKMQNMNKEVALIKEKKPELYNDTNYAFALEQAGYKDYMSGKIDKMGTLSYTPYTDVTKNTLEKIKQLKDLRGEQTIKAPILDSAGQPTGRTVERTIKGLTEQEIFQYFPDLITAAENNQLVIDGWGKYKDRMPLAQAEFNNYTTAKENAINEDIKQADAIVKNTTNTKEKIAEANARIKNLNAQKAELTAFKQSIDINNPVQVGGFLHQASFKDSLANMAQAKWSEEYGVDEYFFDKANLDIKKEELEISKEKLRMEKQKEAPVPTADAISISAREGELSPELNPLKQLQGDYNETYNEMIALTRGAYNSDKTTVEMRNQFKAEMNRMGYDENGAVINQALANKNSKASAFKVAFTESNMNYIHGDVAKKLSGLETKRSALANEFGSTSRESLTETFKKDPDKYIDNIFEKLPDLFEQSRTGNITTKKVNDFYKEVTGKDLTETQKEDIISGMSGTFFGSMIAPSNVQKELKQAFLKNPEKLQILNRYFKDKYEGLGYSKSDTYKVSDLLVDANKISNEKLTQRTKDRKNTYFNTAEIATIKDENLRKNIVNMLPQDVDTVSFDAKNPMSFYKNADGSITIKQNKGYTSGKDQIALKDAEVIVNKEDAAYKELLKYVDLTEKGRGLDASRTTINVKPYRAPYYIDGKDETVVSLVDKQLSNLPINTLQGFVAPPVNYTTKERTEDVYKAALKGKIDEAKVEKFTGELFSTISQFKVKLAPFDNTWAIEVTKPNGERLIKGDTGIVNLEDDMVNLVENYPQTLISDWILRTLIKNPKEIDTLLH